MQKTTIQVDTATKKRAQKVAKDLGLTLSTIIDAFLKQFINEKKSPIKEKTYRMAPKLEAIIKKAEKDIKLNRNMSPVLKTDQEITKYFDSL